MRIEDFIAEQPRAVASSWAAARDFPWNPPAADGIALIGSGSSMNALTVARPLFARAGRGVAALFEPDDFLADLAGGAVGRPLVLVLSQGGASATSVEAAQAAVAAGLPTLAVTAEADSPIARAGARLFHLPIGVEPILPKTKGYAGSIAALIGLAQALGAPPAPPPAPERWAADIEAGRAAAETLASQLDDLDHVMVIGAGAHFGTALEAALKIAEISGVPAAAYPTEEALHGRLYGLTPRSLALIIAHDDPARRQAWAAAEALARRSLNPRILNLTATPTTFDWPTCLPAAPAPWDALVAILPCQWLAVALARRRGLTPETLRYPGLMEELAIKLEAV